MLSTLTSDEERAIAYARMVTRELIDFDAYFRSGQRLGAVDVSVSAYLLTQIELMAEHIETLELRRGRCDLLGALHEISGACDDMLAQHVRQPQLQRA